MKINKSLISVESILDSFKDKIFNMYLGKGTIESARWSFSTSCMMDNDLTDIDINEDILFLIANKSYYPSYISLETAFSYYNIIPEIVYNITSITSKKTIEFNFQNSTFTYNKINSHLFF